MLLMVLMPSVAIAGTQIYLWNGATNTKIDLNGSNPSSVTKSGADLSSYINGTKMYVLPYINRGTPQYAHLNGLSTGQESEMKNGTSYNFTKGDSGGDTYITVPSNYQDYDFTFTLGGYEQGTTFTFTVSWAERVTYQISVDGTTWTTITLGTTIDASLTPFYLRKVTGESTYNYYTATDGTLTPGTETSTTFTSDA